MSASQDFVALDWIKGEIATILQRAQTALEAVVEDPSDATSMRSCLTALHQVHATLRMVELQGPTQVAEEMETLAQALMNQAVDDVERAQEILMQAILQVPSHLDRIQREQSDNPVLLLPIVNNLRTIRGEEAIESDEALTDGGDRFAILADVDADAAAGFERLNGVANAVKLRQHYRRALQQILKKVKARDSLTLLGKVFQTLGKLCGGSAMGHLGQGGVALVEGVAGGALRFDNRVVGWLRDVDRSLAELGARGVDALSHGVENRQVQTLLELFDESDKATPRMERFSGLFPLPAPREPNSGMGPDPEAVAAVLTVLLEELRGVTEKLDLFVRSDDKDLGELAALVPVLEQMSSTLVVVRMSDHRAVVETQIGSLREIEAAGVAPDDEQLIQIAGAFLQVTAELTPLAGEGEDTEGDSFADLDEAQAAVVHEIRNGLAHCKDSVMEFISSNWDRSRLEDVPGTLTSLVGSLTIVEQQRCGDVLAACAGYCQRTLLDQPALTPELEEMDDLADAITSVDYYFERLLENASDPYMQMIEVAEASVARLAEAESGAGQAADAPEPEETDVVALDVDAAGVAAAQTAVASLVEVDADVGSVESEADAEETQAPADHADTAEPKTPEVPDAADSSLDAGTRSIDVSEDVPPETQAGSPDTTGDTCTPDVADPTEEAGVDAAVAAADADAVLISPEILDQPHQMSGEDETAISVSDDASDAGGLATPADELLIGDEILEIFVEEAGEVMESLQQTFPAWRDTQDEEALRDVRRAFHTLKGSGRMVGADVVGELAWSVEDMLNRVIEGTVDVSPAMYQLIDETLQRIPVGVEDFRANNQGATVVADLIARAEAFVSGDGPADTVTTSPDLDAARDAARLGAAADANDAADLSVEETTDLEPALPEEPDRPVTEATPERAAADALEGAAMEGAAGKDSTALIPDPVSNVDPAGDAQAPTTATLAPELVAESAVAADFEASDTEDLQVDELPVESAPEDGVSADETLAATADDAGVADEAPDVAEFEMEEPGLTLAVAEEPNENLAVEDDVLEELSLDTPSLEESGSEEFDLEEAGLDTLGLEESDLEAIGLEEPNLETSESEDAGLDALGLDESGLEEPVLEEPGLDLDESGLDDPDIALDVPDTELATIDEGAADTAADDFELLDVEAGFDDVDPVEARFADDDLQSDTVSVVAPDSSIDSDPVESLADPADENGEADAADEAGFGGFELEDIADFADTIGPADTVEPVVSQADAGSQAEIDETDAAAEADAPFQALDLSAALTDDDLVPTVLYAIEIETVEQAEEDDAAAAGSVEAEPETGTPDRASAPAQEMIRVGADLLEELIILAGESSITRGRVEQQISDFGGSLNEMEETINRIREQVRRLEIEAESRETLIRTQIHADGDSAFDDLEMDRYTMLQEISRSLTEGASDMLDLKDTLVDRSRDAETLLHQQSRIGADLQEGLTSTRMVPFARLIPRLRRIVRQISAEVGKSVRFDAFNVEGEIDRSVLERIFAPLEHMLRNAVDHGIEPVDDRSAANKPETGRISLRLSREGGYFVLEISDDGAGIDVTRVKEKAIERGLMAPDTQLSDHEVMQFIMKAGFSTAQQLTQISGRGVGMDVVDSEIKQLGGTISIDSTLGVGSEFVIRLPFTVSINQALMVVVKEETYAVPLNTIEGIVRVSPYELDAYYQPDAPMFEYAGQPYKLTYMGKVLERSDNPDLEGQVTPLPVILARTGDNAIAMQVDRVIGSREVVVKALGKQFSELDGVSGATVLGDGSVVIILDVMALVRGADAGGGAGA